jgi:hypothetical protein
MSNDSDTRAFLNNILPRAQQVGYVVPYHEFVCMTNPENRGPNWDWNKFVERAVSMTEVTCWQSFTDREWKKWEAKIKEAAMSTAKIHAEQIIKDSGVLEWGGNKKESE